MKITSAQITVIKRATSAHTDSRGGFGQVIRRSGKYDRVSRKAVQPSRLGLQIAVQVQSLKIDQSSSIMIWRFKIKKRPRRRIGRGL